MDNTAIVAKIHKLLALATSDNEAEAALAASKAQTLLLEYNISEQELGAYKNEKSEKVTEVRTGGKNARNVSNWYNRLAWIVGKANLCNVLISGTGLIWIGKPTNIEVAQFMADALSNDLQRIADILWKDEKSQARFYCNLCFRVFPFDKAKDHSVNTSHSDWRVALPHEVYIPHGKTWKNNFYFGAIQTIGERLTENLQQLRVGEQINALVISNDADLREYMHVKYPRLGHSNFNYKRDSSGFEAGKSAGRSIQFRNGIGAGGNSGPKLLGKG